MRDRWARIGADMLRPKQQGQHNGPTGTLLAIGFIGLSLAPLLAAWMTGLEPAGKLQEFASALGLTAVAMILLQFFSSGRYQSLSGRVGLDRTIGFHKVAAFGLVLFAVLHPLVYVAATALVDPASAWTRLIGMATSPRLRTGVAALTILLLIVGLSAWRERLGWRYEYWRGSHGLMAAAVAVLTVHHATTAGSYSNEQMLRLLWGLGALAAVAALLNVYVVRPWRMWLLGWVVESVKASGERSNELTLRIPDGEHFQFEGGQFIWLSLSPNSPPFHDHPFSIASAPSELPLLRLLVREAGDCTNNFGTVRPGTRVAVDGAYGSFILGPTGRRIVMIAGGVGIAPILGMLEQAAAVKDPRPFHLLYAAKSPEALAGLERLRAIQSHLDLELTCFVDTGACAPTYKPGPIQGREIAEALRSAPAEVAAYVCGPPHMMESTTDALLDLGVPPASIQYERFDYGAARGRLDRARRWRALGILACVAVGVALFSFR